MFIWLNKKRGQSTAEYAILISLVIGAAMAMQVYVKRGLQGRIRDAVEHVPAAGTVGGQTLSFSGEQYEPYYLSSAGQSENTGTKHDVTANEGDVKRDIIGTETSKASRRTVTGWTGEDVPQPSLEH